MAEGLVKVWCNGGGRKHLAAEKLGKVVEAVDHDRTASECNRAKNL